MLKIRLQRVGRRNNPSYRVVAVDSRAAAKKGKTVELLGSYDAIRKTQKFNKERILFRIGQGAQVSDTVHNLLIAQNMLEGKKKNVLPKRRPIPKEKEETTNEAPKAQETVEQPEQSEPQEQPEQPQDDTPPPTDNPSPEG